MRWGTLFGTFLDINLISTFVYTCRAYDKDKDDVFLTKISELFSMITSNLTLYILSNCVPWELLRLQTGRPSGVGP